ncbi:MAG: hypothetical protein Q7J54_00780 [Candidatus Woesearchaeota archaeon]|nr:hypothetical protein [Candidatus Woesearchaeota archaeon]
MKEQEKKKKSPTQEKLLELGKKNKELAEEYKRGDSGRKKCLNEALRGFNILMEVVQMPQIATYSMFDKITIDRDCGVLSEYVIYIDEAKIYYSNDSDMLPLFSKVLDENNAKEVISAWSTMYAGPDRYGLLGSLCEISKLGKDKLLERILDDLLG